MTHSKIGYEQAQELFGMCSFKVLDNNKLIGLWFPMLDVDQAIYVPVIPVSCPKELLGVRDGPRQNIAEEGENITSRITKLKKVCNIIKQLVRWLYRLSCNTENTTPLEFATKYFEYCTNPVEDSLKFYDLSRIQRRFPQCLVVSEAISYLSMNARTLFRDGKIIFYNEEFEKNLQDVCHAGRV